MTIIEAIKSGKAFKRRGWGKDYWLYLKPDYNWPSVVGNYDMVPELWIADILADDWEVREE